MRCGQSTLVDNVRLYLELQFTFLSWFHTINSMRYVSIYLMLRKFLLHHASRFILHEHLEKHTL